MSDSRRGFGLDIGFVDRFNKQLIITLNYSAIANFNTL
jgi:ethanolamine utilization microcompartment shell protein EutS